MNKKLINQRRERRIKRTRAKIFGTESRPRLAIFRSTRYSYAQLIDDLKGVTILNASTRGILKDKKEKSGPENLLGALLAKKAAEKGIKQAILDRRGYKYHGRVKAVVDSAREAGLKI